MILPDNLTRDSLAEWKIYKVLKVPKDTDLVQNHRHICVKIENEIFFFVCCTTKEVTIEKFIKLNNLDIKTKVDIPKDENNGFTQDSYVNCNNIHRCVESQLVDGLTDGTIRFLGEIDNGLILKIKEGIKVSTIVPEHIKKLLI